MDAGQPSLAVVAARSPAGTEPAPVPVAAEIRTLLAELDRALRAADAAALSHRQLAALRAIYCGKRPFR